MQLGRVPANVCGCAWVAFGSLACGPPPWAVDAGPDPVAPTLSDIQARVFTPSCSLASCHGGQPPAGALSLRSGEARTALVDRLSRYSPDGGTPLYRVVPGHPEQSLLMDKLDLSDSELQARGWGRRMPRSNQQLPAQQRDAIRQWIAQGAQDN